MPELSDMSLARPVAMGPDLSCDRRPRYRAEQGHLVGAAAWPAGWKPDEPQDVFALTPEFRACQLEFTIRLHYSV